MNSEEEKYMLRCIQLAQNGLCNTAPNPMVGAVIVCDGKIIGEGYHVRFAATHMVSLADNFSVAYDYCAHHRVGGCIA